MAQKRYRKNSRRVSTKKALKVRGGWATSVPRRAFISPSSSITVKGAQRSSLITGKMVAKALQSEPAKAALGAAARSFTSYMDGLGRGTKTKLGMAPSPAGDYIKGEMLPNVEKNSKARRTIMDGGAITSDRYITRFHYGKTPSKMVRMASNMNGSKLQWALDTMQLYQPSASPTSRTDGLNNEFGFNRREYKWYTGITHASIANIASLTHTTPSVSTQAESRLQTSYGFLKRILGNYKIVNRGSHLPIIVKIHLLGQRNETSVGPSGLLQACFNADRTVQENTAIPIRYQLSNLTAEGGISYSVECSNYGSGIFSSQNFKNNFFVAKTFTKKLKPGDIWDFQQEMHFNSGIRLDLLNGKINDNRINEFTAVNYIPVFEVKGVQCQAVRYNESTVNVGTYIGSAPGWWSLEVRRGYEWVTEASQSSDATTTGFPSSDRMMIRTFTRRDTATSQEFSATNSSISTAPAADSVVIPVMSDATITTAQPRA
jgi:hypothetical protein